MSAGPTPPYVSTTAVARDLNRFVESILVTIEQRIDEALAEEGLSFNDARLLLRLPRCDPALGDDGIELKLIDPRARRQLRHLIGRGFAETTSSDSRPVERFKLSEHGRAVLRRLDDARTAALTDLVAGLEPSQQLRLQGAMGLISDRFTSGARLLR